MSEALKNQSTQPDIEAILDQAGIMPTQQRLEIAHVLLKHTRHLSADQLLARVNREEPRVSKATVYNTLSLFVRKGIVREVLVDPNRVFYDSNTGEHYHLYNEDTGDLTDLPPDCLPRNLLPNLPNNTQLVGVDIVIRVRNKSGFQY